MIKKFIYFLFISSLLCSCTFEDVEVGKIGGVSIVSSGKEGLDLEVKIPVRNPNKMGFTISDVNIDIVMNGVDLGRVSQKKSIRVKPVSNDVYPVLFRVKFKVSVEGLPKLLTSIMLGKNIDLKAEGYVKARKFIFTKKFKVDDKLPIGLFNKKN